MKILVVEDDFLVRMMTVEALLDEGFEVIQCETGEQAIAECRRGIADILFTDIRLPGEVTGWDVAELCRGAHPAMPVIYATGYSHVEARPVPGSVWFQKPYQIEHLVNAIRSMSIAHPAKLDAGDDPGSFSRHAASCREMAGRMPAHRTVLLNMARAWDEAARQAQNGEGARLGKIERRNTDHPTA